MDLFKLANYLVIEIKTCLNEISIRVDCNLDTDQ